MHVLEVRNAELMESITRQAAERGITDAAIVALIALVDSFTVSTPPAGDPTAHTYSSYPLPAEMTATGEIVDGKPHIHAMMAVQGDRTIGGHLHKAQIGTSFARAYVIPSGPRTHQRHASPASVTTHPSGCHDGLGGNPRTQTAMLSVV